MRRLVTALTLAAFPALIAAGVPRALASSPAAWQHIPVCPGIAAPGTANCHAILALPTNAGPHFTGTNPNAGYGPTQLRSAYNLPSTTAGSGQTVAIVDAYDDPNAQADVCNYRSTFGIPLFSSGCSGSNGTGPTFRKVNQTGGTSYPRANGGWAQEISLDLDMVSAICPNCNILLVEATTSSLTNLGTAVNTAAALGATEISNSYGGSESSSDTSYDSSYYNHPGLAITVSSGDSGYGAQYPAASQYVTAVGGTSLKCSTGYPSCSGSPTYSETAWGSAGSGCSKYDPQPTWQSSVPNITSVCSNRAIADVSADADPNTGVSVYDTYSYQGSSGWMVFGGTSVASPIIASVYALAGNANNVNYGSYPYSHTSSLNDVTSGSNGSCGNILCNATAGWDGPTGLGSPNGTGAF